MSSLASSVRARSHVPSSSTAQVAEPVDLAAAVTVILSDLREIKAVISGRIKAHYTIEEVAQMVGRSAFTVRRWVSEKRITATRVSGTGPKGKLLISREQLATLIDLGSGGNIPDSIVN
jgi:excisionase family DNA binding protein